MALQDDHYADLCYDVAQTLIKEYEEDLVERDEEDVDKPGRRLARAQVYATLSVSVELNRLNETLQALRDTIGARG